MLPKIRFIILTQLEILDGILFCNRYESTFFENFYRIHVHFSPHTNVNANLKAKKCNN